MSLGNQAATDSQLALLPPLASALPGDLTIPSDNLQSGEGSAPTTQTVVEEPSPLLLEGPNGDSSSDGVPDEAIPVRVVPTDTTMGQADTSLPIPPGAGETIVRLGAAMNIQVSGSQHAADHCTPDLADRPQKQQKAECGCQDDFPMADLH